MTTYTYDETGQLVSMTDPCGNSTCSDISSTSHTTTYSYADSFTILSGSSNIAYTPGGNTNSYLTKLTNALGQNKAFTYDFNNGQLTASQDQNDINAGRAGTTYIYDDLLARPTQVTYADGGQTEYVYSDVPSSPSATTCQNISAYPGSINIWVNGVKWDQAAHDPTGCMSQYKVAQRAQSVAQPPRPRGGKPMFQPWTAWGTWSIPSWLRIQVVPTPLILPMMARAKS